MSRTLVMPKSRVPPRAAALVLLAGLLVVACGGPSGGDTASPDTGAPTTPAPRAFDPPTAFTSVSGRPLPVDGLVPELGLLDGTAGWSATDSGLLRVDLLSGQVAPAAAPTGQPFGVSTEGSDAIGKPVVARAGAAPVVVGAFPVRLVGSGTAAPRSAAELVAARADTGDRLFTVPMPVGEWASPGVRLSTRVVGISSDGAVAVVSIDNAFGASSFGVDLAARRIVWTAPDFKAAAVAGDTAVGPTTGSGAQGLGPSMLRGLAAATGVQRWSAADGSDVEVAGANLVAVAGKVYASGKSFFRLLAGDSGRQVQSADVSFENFPQCRWDERDVTVCFTAGFGDRAFGIDSNTARLLWQLPDQGGTRVAPQVITAAWHGAVYGETGNGSVVLDGRTGADRSADPGASPQLVNEYFGVGVPPGKKTDRVQVRRDLFLYPASG